MLKLSLIQSLLIYISLTALWSSLVEDQVVFLGEDWHMSLPVGGAQVIFKPRIGQPGRQLDMMTDGKVVNPRVKLNQALSHVILENVGESDEGLYIISSEQNPDYVKQINLVVRGDIQLSVIHFISPANNSCSVQQLQL